MCLLIFFSMMLSAMALCFACMVHPMAMGLTLIIQTILICATAGLLSTLSWFSYILFLIFLGATLVLFIYVASLASNEIFKMKPTMIMVLLTPLLSIPFFLFPEVLLLPDKEVLEASSFIFPQELTGVQIKLNNIYNPTSAALTATIVLYLLLTLIVVVEISSSFFGPLRLS
uniref:NADH dehydrogenase subunit 6 n=1 Tax=Palaemon australis TaxID=179142 RepID=UPI003003198C|nr:NADH dehydrogenase subunit 6 [Palaemon australis]